MSDQRTIPPRCQHTMVTKRRTVFGKHGPHRVGHQMAKQCPNQGWYEVKGRRYCRAHARARGLDV